MKIIFTFIAIMIIIIPLASAISEEALNINNSLSLAEKDMEKMMNKDIPITRYSDTLILTKQMYEAQLFLENTSKDPDYSLVQKKIEELKEIKQNAFTASDELKALEIIISQIKEIDLAPILEIYQEARNEFYSERYEECLELIDETYEKISELEALQTKLKAFYEATSRSFINFIKEQWIALSFGISGSLFAFAFTYNRFMSWAIKKMIENLEKRRESIKKLIKKTQKAFFQDGSISGSTYHIRIKKYAEMIRDINRQIPLLKEELKIKKTRRF